MKRLPHLWTILHSRYLLIVLSLLTALYIVWFGMWTGDKRILLEKSDYELNYTWSEAEIDNLTNLLKQKIKNLMDANLLSDLGDQRFCTSEEEGISRCIEPDCPGVMATRISASNIQSIRKPVRGVGMDNLRKVIEVFDVKPAKTKYVFLTAASSNHFEESKAAIDSLHTNILPYISNYTIYYYDLGLTGRQSNHVRSSFRADLRDFPFDKLPARFGTLYCYTWKPLIVLAHINTSEITIWFDSSIHFLKDMRPLFLKATTTGFLVNPNGYQFAQHVCLKMFSYFGDIPCQLSIFQ